MRRPLFFLLMLALVLFGSAVPVGSLCRPLELGRGEVTDYEETSAVLPLDEGNVRVYLPLVVSNFGTASGTVTPENGGRVATGDGRVSVTVPPGAVTGVTTLTIEPSEAQRPADLSDLDRVFDIKAYDALGRSITTFAKPLLVQLSYTGVEETLIPGSNLAMYHREGDGSWVALSTVIDAAVSMAQAYTTQLSAFGLFAPPGILIEDPEDVPTIPYPLGITVDAAGNLYWLDFNSWYIQKLTPGATVAEPYYNYGSAGFGMDLNAADLDIDRSTRELYFTNGTKVFKVTPAGEQSEVYDSTSGYSYDSANSIHFDQRDGSLYIAGKWSIIQINPQTGELIKKLPQVSYSSTSAIQDVIVDSQGRVFAITMDWGPSGLPFNSQFWGSVAYLTDADAYSWLPVASGLAQPRRLAVDSQDTLYVSNVAGDAITIVSGDDPMVTGFIRTADIPRGIATYGSTLWVGAEGGVYSFPRIRRDGPVENLSATLAPAGTISGQGNLLTIHTSVTETVPAHHLLQIAGTPVRDLVGFSGDTLTYKLPDAYWTGSEFARLLGPASGACGFIVGAQAAPCGSLTMPEWGNWQFASWAASGDTIYLTQHDWLIWSKHTMLVASVVSQEGLFADWDTTTGDTWLAYQFNQAGTFTFTVTDDSAQTIVLHVEVTRLGPGGRQQKFEVDPAVGGTLYNQGSKLEIPAGALPGTDPYVVTLVSLTNTPAGVGALGNYPESSWEYQVQYDPEPEHLNAEVVFTMPYDALAVSAEPQGAIFDRELADYVGVASQASEGYVTIGFSAGDYLAVEASGQVLSLGTRSAETGVAQSGGVWETLKGGLNTLGQSLWWATGLPDAREVDTNFGIIYHTADGVSETYAKALLNALNEARNVYIAKGYTVPDHQVIVKIAPWATTLFGAEGFVPRVGLLGHWYMFINHSLTPDQIKVTAAHEFFHIVQREMMAENGGSAPTWWMEGTATWAEYAVCPSVALYTDRFLSGGDFPNVSYGAWSGGLSADQEYATMAFALYMEDQHPNAVWDVFSQLSATAGIYQAIRLVVGDDAEFYADFAKAYWSQSYGPAASWDLNAFIPTVKLADARTSILDRSVVGLSSGMINVYYDVHTTPNPPLSFSQASGSVVRAPQTCTYSQIYTLDADKQELGRNFLGAVAPTLGYPMGRLITYDRANDLYFLYVNADPDNVFGSCDTQVVLESPTIDSVSPSVVTSGQTTRVTVSGSGFGPQTGTVSQGTVVSWNENVITIDLTPGSVGDITLRVNHAAGVSSNPETVEAQSP